MTTIKSCDTCPSFVVAGEVADFLGVRDASGPMCARFGRVLYDPENPWDTSSRVRIGRFIGTSCSSHGLPRPTIRPEVLATTVWTPDAGLLEASDAKDVLDSCDSCAKFEAHDSGLKRCGALGLVLFESELVRRAAGCEWAEQRPSSVPVGFPTRTKLPSYTDAATAAPAAKPSKPARPALPDVVDYEPSEYETDVKVSDADSHMFAAWRKIVSPHDGREFYLPIFKTDFFPEEEQALIPKTGSDQHPELYVDHGGLLFDFAVSTYKLDLTMTLVGEPGTGKTEGVRWLAWLLNMPFVRLGFNEYSEPEQYLGLYQADPAKGTYFDPGFLPERWVRPGFLLSDEFNLAPEGIVQVYRSMNDSSRSLTIYKENFARHDYCFHIGALNPAWDFRNIGAKELADADTSRLVFKWMTLPDERTMRKIIAGSVERITGEGIDPHVLEAIIRIGKDLRSASQDSTLNRSWTIRQEVKVGMLAQYLPLDVAYKRALLDFLSPEEQEVALTCIKSHMA